MYRRSRPACLPIYGQGTNTNQPNLPVYGYNNYRTNTTYNNDSMNRLPVPGYQSHYIKPRTPPPRSPILDQVLTDFRPGPGVVWFCEKKRDKSRSVLYRKLIVGFILLAAFGLAVYKGINFAPGRTRAGYRFELEDEISDEVPMDNSMPVHEKEHIQEVHTPVINEHFEDALPIVENSTFVGHMNHSNGLENAESVILEGNFTENTLSLPTHPARIKIVYSVNEDLESTVEVIEG